MWVVVVAIIVFLFLAGFTMFELGFRSEKIFWVTALGSVLLFLIYPVLIAAATYWFVSSMLGGLL